MHEDDIRELKHCLASRLVQPVQLLVFLRKKNLLQHLHLQRPHYCRETGRIAEQLASLNPLLDIKIYHYDTDTEAFETHAVTRTPCIIASGPGVQLRHYGVPVGYELSGLLEQLTAASQQTLQLADETIAALARLDRPVHIQVFGTASCPFCPLAVYTASQFAAASPHIRAESLDAAEFPDLVQQYDIKAVPRVVINGQVNGVGALCEADLLALVQQAAQLVATEQAS